MNPAVVVSTAQCMTRPQISSCLAVTFADAAVQDYSFFAITHWVSRGSLLTRNLVSPWNFFQNSHWVHPSDNAPDSSSSLATDSRNLDWGLIPHVHVCWGWDFSGNQWQNFLKPIPCGSETQSCRWVKARVMSIKSNRTPGGGGVEILITRFFYLKFFFDTFHSRPQLQRNMNRLLWNLQVPVRCIHEGVSAEA